MLDRHADGPFRKAAAMSSRRSNGTSSRANAAVVPEAIPVRKLTLSRARMM
jgi:hypothetical protein